MVERVKLAQSQVKELELVSNRLQGFLTKNVAKGIAIGAITSGAGSFIDSNLSGDSKEIASAANNVVLATGAGFTFGGPTGAVVAFLVSSYNEMRQAQSRQSEQIASADKAIGALRKRLSDHATAAKDQREADLADRRKLRQEVLEMVRKRGEAFLDQASRFLGAGDEF